MIPDGSLVIINLHSPKEQFWGTLLSITPMGVTAKAININSFEDWVHQVAKGEEKTIDLIMMFFPMHRVDRVFMDEDVGAVESMSSRFARLVGISVENYLDGDAIPDTAH